MKRLPPKQEALAKAIITLTEERGFAPSFSELAAKLDISHGTVQEQLRALKRKGVVTWVAGLSRTLRVQNWCLVMQCKGCPDCRGIPHDIPSEI